MPLSSNSQKTLVLRNECFFINIILCLFPPIWYNAVREVNNLKKKEFYSKWIETFAANIPKKALENRVFRKGGYIWHVFSFGLLDKDLYYEGEQARAEYEKAKKKGAFYIDWDMGDETCELTHDLCFADALDKFAEIYVVGKDFEWTYIKTHEGDLCGPYFLKLK